MANNARAEVDFELDGRKFTGRADFSALCAIESEFGCSVTSFVKSMTDLENFRMYNTAFILHACIKAVEGKDAPSVNEVGDMMMADGWQNSIQHAMMLLTKGVTTLDDEDEAKAGKPGRKRKASRKT